jgi:putative OPT family oligopeptide transporter
MTIATIMGTCLIFTSVGWSGKAYEPLALVVGGMICIAAANAGGTSQDLKTGYIVGATPRYQQLSLFIGAIVSSIAIGLVLKILDTPTAEMVQQNVHHAIGTDKFPGPQATLMATLIKGIQSGTLDWQFIMVGVFIAITLELCGVKALAFAIGLYLPLATTLPIFVGGALKGYIDWRERSKGRLIVEDELGKGSLFATGLIAGGALTGVFVAILAVGSEKLKPNLGFDFMERMNLEDKMVHALGHGGYELLGTAFFIGMMVMLYRLAKDDK